MNYLPINFISLYIIGTLFISFWGPMKYYDYDKLSVCVYVVLFLICLNMGFFLASKVRFTLSQNRNQTVVSHSDGKDRSILPLISFSITIAVVGSILQFVDILQHNPTAFSLGNLGANYIDLERGGRSSVYDYSYAILFRFLTGFFRNIALILGFYYYKKLSRKKRMELIIFTILLVLVNVVASGTQKFLGDILIYSIVIGIVKMLDLDKKKRRAIIYRCTMTMVLVVVIFAIMQAQRYSLIGVTASNYGSRSDGFRYFDIDNIVFRIFGEDFGFGIATFLTYISQGYYGLSLCLQLPFEWTYGVGSSYVISTFLSRFLDFPNIYEMTYLNRMEWTFGVKGLVSWNTIFPWIASDFTFIGALLIFIPIGYVFGLSWNEVVKYRNPVSLLMFATIFLGLIFVPANNQLFHGVDTCLSTLAISAYWLANHNKYNIRKKYE